MKLLFAFALLLTGSTGAIAGTGATSYRVAPDCEGVKAPCYTRVQDALDAAERDMRPRWITVRVAAGNYAEKPVIRRAKLRLIGAGAGQTRIHFGAVAQTAGRYHRANWGTPGSATLTINAADVRVAGVTIENTYDYLGNDRLAADDPAKIGNPQAAALLLDIDSDRVLVEHSALLGYQDTLFANGARGVIRDSLIAGNIDFIFGNGQLLIERSEIRTRNRSAALKPGEFHSFIAAPSTPLSQPIGIVFYASRLTREEGVPDGSVALARPWHPTRRFPDGRYADPEAVGHALYIDSFMDAHIHPDHWTTMNGTSRDGTMSTVFHPQDTRFQEVGSQGPGARARDIGMRWRGETDIRKIRQAFRQDWRWLD